MVRKFRIYRGGEGKLKKEQIESFFLTYMDAIVPHTNNLPSGGFRLALSNN